MHHRELERLLRLAGRHAKGDKLELTPELVAELALPEPAIEVCAAAVSAALAESKNAAEAARRLGLSSRFALYRLMKKFGLDEGAIKRASS